MSTRKRRLAPRNPLVAASLKRKAGKHQKSNKSLRRLEKSRGGLAHLAEHEAFNLKVASSSLAAPTTIVYQDLGFFSKA